MFTANRRTRLQEKGKTVQNENASFRTGGGTESLKREATSSPKSVSKTVRGE